MKATIVTFKKVLGWADGPLKPSSSTINGTVIDITTGISTAITGLASGETAQVIIEGSEVIE